jgi:hypothetical protein
VLRCAVGPASGHYESGMTKAFESRRGATDSKHDLVSLSHYPICTVLETHFNAIFGTSLLFFSEPDWLASSCLCSQYLSLAFWQIQSPACRCVLETHLRGIGLQPDSLSIERESANVICQIFQKGIVSAFGGGSPWLR